MVTWRWGAGGQGCLRGAGLPVPLPRPRSPHWASSEQSVQSHTKLHVASPGALQWLGTQAQLGDAAARRETARWPGAGWPPQSQAARDAVHLLWDPGQEVGEGGGWVLAGGLLVRVGQSTPGPGGAGCRSGGGVHVSRKLTRNCPWPLRLHLVQEWRTGVPFWGPLALGPGWTLGPDGAEFLPLLPWGSPPKAHPAPPHPPQATQSLAPLMGRPDDSPSSRTRAGRRWPGRRMVGPGE